MKTKITVSTIAVLCVMSSMPAFSQSQINPSDAAEKAAEKTKTPAPKGYAAGDFILKPSLTVNEEYNDNIYTEDNNEVGDFVTHIIPKLTAELKGYAHQLKIAAGLEQVIYADETQNHYLNYDATISDRYNFDKTSYWAGSVGYRKRHSLPGDDDANPGADAGEPLPYNMYDASTRLSKDFGNVELTPRASFRRYEFDSVRRVNGTNIDQGGRDRDHYNVGGRANVPFNKDSTVFVDLDWAPINYLQETAAERDSNGGNYLAGLRWSPDKTISVEAGLGLLTRNYDTAAYNDIDTLGATVSIAYAPMPGSKLAFDYDRSIIEVTDAGVGGAVRDNVKASFSKDLTDLWTGRLNARYARTDYDGGLGATGGTRDRKDEYFSLGAGASYALTETVAFTADYTYGNNDSNRNTADYDQNVFLLGVKAGF
jgi:hypothetical protein